VDWSRVDVFWGDERYVPADSDDRNDGRANRILFDNAPFKAARRFSMPASDGPFGADLDGAAEAYAEILHSARRPDDPDEIPNFDVVLLGVGPDGHCASLFPGHPGVYDDSGPVIAVRNAPKPPPNRISLSFSGLAAANEIWFVVAGAAKAEAVALAWSGAGRTQVPAAGPRGRLRTLWLVDHDAASRLPKHRYEPPML
jgi:6-phosphogluconolactonase